MKMRFLFMMMFCAAFFAGQAQTVTVKGKVTDRTSGAPLIGATVFVKSDKTKTALTNDVGEFTLSVPSADAILVVQYLGYKDVEQKLINGDVQNISMDAGDANSLDEVVVVGAVVKKSNLTGAVASIGADKIAQTPTTSINQALQGKVTGAYVVNSAQPGNNASIQIRGNNSIQFGTNPIFVVDGVIIDGGFNTLNPDDIASVDILKDASSTAIYGSRGANGVVIITTKKGKSGTAKVTYNTWLGWQSFSKKMDLMNAQQLFDLRVDAYANKFIDDNPDGDRQDYINRYLISDTSVAFAQYELQSQRDGKSYDWLDAVTRKGMQQNHTLNFSGGTDKGTYFRSLNYTDQKGLMKNSDYKRFGGRFNLEQNIKPWLKVGTNTTFTRTVESYVDGSVFNVAVIANPFLPVDTAGLYFLKYQDITDQNLYNPLRSLYIDGDNYSNRLLSANYIQVTPIKNLNIRSTLSADLTNQSTFWYTPTTTGQDVRNSYHGSASQRKDSYSNLQWDNTITYNKSFGTHNLSLLGGTSMQQNNWNYNQVNAYGFPNDDLGRNLGAASAKDKTQLSSDFITNTLLSYLVKADYNYNYKYFITGTVRYDGSSKFGSNNRWGTFPSVAVAWDMAKENFMQSVGFINRFKWRAGYGIAGNQNIPNYATVSLYGPDYSGGTVSYRPTGTLGNPDLKWERQRQLNLGVDISLFKSRLNLSADYFNINNDNLLMVRSLSSVAGLGYNTAVYNVGSLNNRGVEFNVNYAVIRKNDLQWNVNANISSSKNKITELYGNTTAIYNKGGFTGVEIQRTGNLFVGESLNTIYSYKFQQIAQEADMAKLSQIDFGGRTVQPGDIVPVDRNGDGVINDDDRFVVGNLTPKFFGGFNTDITYKGLGLNMFFTYSYGLKRISGFYDGLMSSAGVSAAHQDLLNRWTPQNTNTNVPRALYGTARYNYGDVDLGVQNASFLRLATFTLFYNLPSAMAKSVLLDNARIYVTGSNMLLFTKDKGYDPETGDGYPNNKMMTVGLNVGF